MLLHYAVLIIETLFFVGLVGSLTVTIMALIGDLRIFSKEK